MIFIGLKSIQQLNVQHYLLKWIPITSFLMAFVEYGCVAIVATQGYTFTTITALGAGAGLGSLGATVLHRKWRKE